MKYFVEAPIKFILSNFAVILAIMLLPIFLVTNSVPFFESIIDYLFNNQS